MKRRSIFVFIPLFVLAACSHSKTREMNLEDFSSLLRTTLLEKEIANSSQVTYQEVYNLDNSRIYTSTETFTIYEDETSFAEGTEKVTFPSENLEYVDTYQHIITTETYDNQKIFYYVVDFADGTLRTSWVDIAERLPVYTTGNADYDGINYLLASSLPGQLTKQVSLLSNQFIQANILGNPDVQMVLPKVQVIEEKDVTTYSVKDFTYSYEDDDDSEVTVSIEFEIKTSQQGLTSSSLHYRTVQTRGEESYVTDDQINYDVQYGNRLSSQTNPSLIDPTDYFLEEVKEVKAYVYENGEKEYVEFTNLPLNKYVHFEASDYEPKKAVDLEMYAVASTEPSVVSKSGNLFETIKTGEATLTVESATGIQKTIDVRVNMPAISRIKYNDTSSDIEVVASSNETIRYIYTNTTYDHIYLSVTPSTANLGDIAITVSDPNALEVTILSQTSSVLELQYRVQDTYVSQEITITFTSKINENISTSVTYQIKERLTDAEMQEKLIGHSYRWNNLYNSPGDDYYAIMTFTDATHGTIRYYNGQNFLEEAHFTYSFHDTTFTPVMEDGALYGYNSGDITLDGNKITMRVNETEYVHYYEIVEA